MSSPPVCWSFHVQYKVAKQSNDGVLEYYPAEGKAILYDSEMNKVDSIMPIQAGSLAPGGELQFGETRITIMMWKTAGGIMEGAVKETVSRAVKEETIPPTVPPTVPSTAPPTAPPLQFEIIYSETRRIKTKTWMDGWVSIDNLLATFYSEDNRIIHKKKFKSITEVVEGLLLETASYCIEITAPIIERRTARTKRAVEEKSMVEDVTSSLPQASQPHGKYAMLWTTDKVKKAKRWKDGILSWDASTQLAVFTDEGGRTLFKRKLLTIGEDDINTAQYIFQIGERLEGGGEEEERQIEEDENKNVNRCVSGVGTTIRSKGSGTRIFAKRKVPVDEETEQKAKGEAGRSSKLSN